VILRTTRALDAYSRCTPRLEKEKGRSLSGIGFTDVAFTRKDIVAALESLKGSQVAVLGGEVMEIVNGKIQHQHTYDNWPANKRPEEVLILWIT
jgi:Immunity protein 40